MHLFTRYAKEIKIGQQVLKLEANKQYDVSPFYPLLTFPDMNSSSYKTLERQCLKSENATGRTTLPPELFNPISAILSKNPSNVSSGSALKPF